MTIYIHVEVANIQSGSYVILKRFDNQLPITSSYKQCDVMDLTVLCLGQQFLRRLSYCVLSFGVTAFVGKRSTTKIVSSVTLPT